MMTKAKIEQYIRLARAYAKAIPAYNNRYSGRGIVICAGGDKYFPGAWVTIRMLRDLKCCLPIQLWYLGRREISLQMEGIVKKLGVKCVDALEVAKTNPCRILNGYELKPFALVHSIFKEVLLLDADNVPIVNPNNLFHLPQFRQTGAIFWPRPNNGPAPKAWRAFDVPYRYERGFDTAQLLISKARSWRALCLTLWYNSNSDYYYQFVDGEKETFHLAFRKLNATHLVVGTLPVVVDRAVYQHDLDGRRIFQHRSGDKWKMYGLNRRIQNFEYEDKCFHYLDELRDCLKRVSSANVRLRRPKVVIRCPIDGFTGYGQHAQQIIRHFLRMKYYPRVIPIRVDESESIPIPQEVKQCFSHYSDEAWELVLNPPDFSPVEGKRTIFFTMWESTRLSSNHIQNLKKAQVIVVPCEWNANTFSAQGIEAPIEICPLGVDESIFSFRDLHPNQHCVFGAAGNSHISGRTRKGLDEVIEAFRVAFPKERDVRLKVKILPGSKLIEFRDARIIVSKAYLTQEQLAEWYSSLTCFVSAAKAEAWGLMQHQAMAVGRPVIACNYGGLREFFDSTVGYPVEYTLVPADERYSGLGLWAQPDLESLVQQMRRVYNFRDEAARIGRLAANRVSRLSWQQSSLRLLAIVRKYVE